MFLNIPNLLHCATAGTAQELQLNLRALHRLATFDPMPGTLNSIRTSLAILALVVHVGAGLASACAARDCGTPPPAGTIAAACCCDDNCDSLVAAEPVSLPSEVSISDPGIANQVLISILLAASRPLAITSAPQLLRPHLHLFQLHQSYRL